MPSNGEHIGLSEAHAARVRQIHQQIFAWAHETLTTRRAFLQVLHGTILPPMTMDVHQAIVERVFLRTQLRDNRQEVATMLALLKQSNISPDA